MFTNIERLQRYATSTKRYQDICSLVRVCSHEPGIVNYPGVMIAIGQVLPSVHMITSCPEAMSPVKAGLYDECFY